MKSENQIAAEITGHIAAFTSFDVALIEHALNEVPISDEHYVMLVGMYVGAMEVVAPTIGCSSALEAIQAMAVASQGNE
jgi:hypothetical protein